MIFCEIIHFTYREPFCTDHLHQVRTRKKRRFEDISFQRRNRFRFGRSANNLYRVNLFIFKIQFCDNLIVTSMNCNLILIMILQILNIVAINLISNTSQLALIEHTQWIFLDGTHVAYSRFVLHRRLLSSSRMCWQPAP